MKALDFARPALITIALITLSGQISWAQRLTNSAVNPYMHARANELQGVSNSNLVEINAQPVIGMHYSATIMLEGQPRTLHMDPHSVRAADFAIYRSSADGGLVEVSPGPVRTMRGYVENVPGSRIAGAILPRGLNAKIRMPSGRMYGLVAVTNVIPGASPTTHMLFDLADSTEPSATCGFQPAAVAEAPANPTGGTCETVGPIVARIGCDIDSAFVHGGGGGCSPPGSCGGGTPEDADDWGSVIAAACPGPLSEIGLALGADALLAYFKAFGFYSAPEVRLPSVAQNAPSSLNRPGVAAIGQSGLLLSPLQMAQAAAALSNYGSMPALQIALSAEDNGQPVADLKALAASRGVLEGQRAANTALSIGLDALPIWQVTAQAFDEDGSRYSWYLGGSLPESEEAEPNLTLVVLLEGNQAGLIEEIGQSLLLAAMGNN